MRECCQIPMREIFCWHALEYMVALIVHTAFIYDAKSIPRHPHRWSRGMMIASHAIDPGSSPGRCTDSARATQAFARPPARPPFRLCRAPPRGTAASPCLRPVSPTLAAGWPPCVAQWPPLLADDRPAGRETPSCPARTRARDDRAPLVQRLRCAPCPP